MVVIPPIHVESPPDIVVRTAAPEDADAFLAMVTRNREHLGRYLPRVVSLDTREKVLQHIAHPSATPEIEVIDLHVLFRGELSGALRLNNFDHESHKASLAYFVDAAHAGRGIVTRAARALIGVATGTLGIHRLEIRCVTDNTASIAVAERLGFTREGRLRDAERLHGRYVDHFIYSLLPGELR